MLNLKLSKNGQKTKNNFVTKYGIINTKRPEVICIKMKGKVIPMTKKNNYYEDVHPIKDKITKYINRKLSDCGLFSDKKIVTLELSDNSVTYLRDTNIKYNFYIIPKIKKNINEYYDEFSTLTTEINDFISDTLNEIDFISK